MAKNRVIFFISDAVHILDLAGPVQAFYEATNYGHPYELLYVSDNPGQTCSAQLQLAKLKSFTGIKIVPTDIIIIPGYNIRSSAAKSDKFYSWLRRADQVGATICSICTGAFTLAQAGVLDHKECTTHWMSTDKLQKRYPALKVLTNRLFVKCGNIYTSAGVTTGMDLALYLLEERHGPEFIYRLARELVLYIRRDGHESQESIYLQYRRHMHAEIHTVQDWMIRNLEKKIRVEELAALAFTSPRNLTRLFKATTGITIGQYIEKLRVEKALHLLHHDNKIGSITKQCGLQSANQLRHIIKKHTGRLPSALRTSS